jgi:3-oxoacyl-[acyl-carrier protein] reductase
MGGKMDLGISGKRALVVGGTSNLGKACAFALAAEGVNLLLFARNEENLKTTATEIKNDYNVQVATVAGNIESRSDVEQLGQFIRETDGFDILVLNSPRPPMPMRNVLDEQDDARWQSAHDGVLKSSLLLVRELVPILVQRGWGRVVAITSASVKQPMPHHALSTVYRVGLTALLKHLANEIAENGVTVNCVAPASVLTEGFQSGWNLEERRRQVPMRRFGTPTEFAAAVTFLSSELAGFTTGATIPVDGGLVGSLT